MLTPPSLTTLQTTLYPLFNLLTAALLLLLHCRNRGISNRIAFFESLVIMICWFLMAFTDNWAAVDYPWVDYGYSVCEVRDFENLYRCHRMRLEMWRARLWVGACGISLYVPVFFSHLFRHVDLSKTADPDGLSPNAFICHPYHLFSKAAS